MKITDVLRRGKSNGIPLKDLPKACGLGKRAARQAIEAARAKEPIINMQDGSGYFIPTEDEAPPGTHMAQPTAQAHSFPGKRLRRGRKMAQPIPAGHSCPGVYQAQKGSHGD